jgi:hypothetical protein
MGKSHAGGLIDRATYELWCDVSELRNCVVHNNGIADVSLNIHLPNGVLVSMREGEMTGGNIRTYALVVRSVIDAYAAWCDAFLRKAR